MERGQAAMEFMTTYGWAIMVVLVAIGALSYFGVFDFDNLTPERCVVPTGLSCTDFFLSDATEASPIQFSIHNNLGQALRIQADSLSFECDGCTVNVPKLNSDCYFITETGKRALNEDATIKTDGFVTFQCPSAPYIEFDSPGSQTKVWFEFDYMGVREHYPNHAEGEIVAKVREGS